MFSSVEGFSFLWKVSNNKIIELAHLSHDKREASKKRMEVERTSYSDYVLLKGLSTGKITISAELTEEGFTSIESDSKVIYVIEQFVIYPDTPLYILPLNSFDYDIKLITNELQRVDIKYDQRSNYIWNLNNKKCGQIKGFGKFSSSNITCQTDIEAADTRIDIFKTDTKKIYVVYPTTLEIGLMELNDETAKELVDKIELLKNFESFVQAKNLEGFNNLSSFTFSRNWNLVIDKYYIVKNVLLYNTFPVYSNKNFVTYIMNFSKMLEFDKHITVIKCSKSNEYCLIKATVVTLSKLIVEIDSTTVITKDNRFSMKKFIRIVERVRIQKFGLEGFTLPYLGYGGSDNKSLLSQELKLIVNGGTGKYIFYSDNTNVISIKQEILYGEQVGRSVNT